MTETPIRSNTFGTKIDNDDKAALETKSEIEKEA